MTSLWSRASVASGALLVAVCAFGQSPAPAFPASLVTAGQTRFIQQCGFCHGRDAGGGETGPDLTRSKLVAEDRAGEKIGPVVREGRAQNGMPRFTVSDQELAELAAFIHTAKITAETQKGGRRGVDTADLQTGDRAAGERYFNGEGKCRSCHSPTGDLAGVAKRFDGLHLEQRLLYPRGAKATVTVTLPSGEKVEGTLGYQDEFTIGLRDASDRYQSWSTKRVKFAVNDPAAAHAELLGKYTDANIHDLMAYLQTLQ